MAITSQVINENAGVTVSQNEWTLAITAQAITESAGVTVTQGSVTGTLKTALTGDSTNLVIETDVGVSFVTNVNIVIGSTTVVLANINTATNTVSISGTLKTALTGTTTSLVIETASAITFVTTSSLRIGGTIVAFANVNTATNNGATTSVVITAAAGVSFGTSDSRSTRCQRSCHCRT